MDDVQSRQKKKDYQSVDLIIFLDKATRSPEDGELTKVNISYSKLL